jgi:orotidine-5'-phosphate decarboxylase
VIKKSQFWASPEELMYVAGATRASILGDIRKLAPNHFLLVPGVGAQGGSLAEVAKYGMNATCGLIVNSSRGIIYADKSQGFAKTAGEKAKELRDEMDDLLTAFLPRI